MDVSLKFFLTFLFSSIALLFAGVSLYRTHFKPAKIKIHVGETITLWHENSNLAFDIPVSLANVGRKPGIVHSMAIIISNPKIKEENFFIKWKWFLNFNTEKNNWGKEGFIIPISVNQDSCVFKYINFISSNSKIIWSPNPGKYKIIILGWSKKRNKPDLKEEFNIYIDEAKSEQIRKNLSLNKGGCNYIFRSNCGNLTSKNLSIKELNNLIN